MCIEVEDADIEDFHRFNNANRKNTLVGFANHKFCSQALDKKVLWFNQVKT